MLVATLGMTAGLFSALLAGGHWSPAVLSSPAAGLWWTGAWALVISLLCLLLAVVPRYRVGTWAPGQPLSYFGDVQQAARLGRLADAIADTERNPSTGLTVALAANSRIAAQKHQWIRAGLIAFSVGIVLVPAALLLG
ncbi:Pycsar system effector family protein [Streptomyces cylindrosporus]|uniref:Pycsar system effector family protein n=1 Tax=Streptomyces cylindrosporus TaxID=2927583 RepID=UPI0027E2FC82|nr:Pycsar system effector family protein [Streptomyces cylindrosporus]